MSRYPEPPAGISLDDLRRGVVSVGARDGVQERSRKRAVFRTALPEWISRGGRCDLLTEGGLPNSPVGQLSSGLQALALGKHGGWSSGGVVDGHIEEPMFQPHEEGYCYLVTVREDAYNKAAEALGYNPWRPSVLAWLLANPSVHSGARFRVGVGIKSVGPGSHVQMHITVSSGPGSMDWKEALSCGPANTRVGAELRGNPTRDEKGVTGGGEMSVATPSVQHVITIPFYAVLKHTDGKCTFNPRLNSGVKQLTTYFESARLVDVGCTITINGGKDSMVSVGFSTGANPPTSFEGFLALPTAVVLSGADTGSVTHEVRLPPEHSFGTELKAACVGNPSPVLHVCVDTGTPTIAMVRGSISMSVTGVGVPASILLPVTK